MPINWLAVLVSSFIPVVLGVVWYHPKILGKVWMKADGLTSEDFKNTNKILRIGISLICSFLISAMLMSVVIHQIHIFSIMQHFSDFGEEGSKTVLWLADFMGEHGEHFRTFRHGLIHGALLGVFFTLPLITINAFFEGRGFKSIAIKSGFWIISLSLMGGIISGWQ